MRQSKILLVTFGLFISPFCFAENPISQMVYHPNQDTTTTTNYVSDNSLTQNDNAKSMKESEASTMNEYNRGVKQIVISGW